MLLHPALEMDCQLREGEVPVLHRVLKWAPLSRQKPAEFKLEPVRSFVSVSHMIDLSEGGEYGTQEEAGRGAQPSPGCADRGAWSAHGAG